MKEFYNVPCDLYIHKSDIGAMEKGNTSYGHVSVPEHNKQDYELINKYCFQQITEADIVDKNTFVVSFILD